MSAFLDTVVFPTGISEGSTGGPDWPADVVTLASGFEERTTTWAAPLRMYDAKWGVRTRDELYQILNLYHVAHGRLYGFRYLDPTDFQSGSPLSIPSHLDQTLGTGDGTQTAFQLIKTYRLAGAPDMRRDIKKPFGTLLIGVDGVATAAGWTLDAATGIVTFAVAPAVGAVLTWGGQFHVPVRFDTKLDQISVRQKMGDIPSIFLKELKL